MQIPLTADSTQSFTLNGSSPAAPKPAGVAPKAKESDEEKDDEKKVDERPSILNPDQDSREAAARIEANQKVLGLLESSGTVALLGSTVDLKA